MIYLKLFITFLQIGSVSFGGGYSILKVISLLRDTLVKRMKVK